jgi:curved DNA-binding protein CbpA
MNLYEQLKVSQTASPEEIQKAYRRLAKNHHPDAGGTDEAFKEITRAYEILGDPDKRRDYDTYGDPNDRNLEQEVRAQVTGLLLQIIDEVDVDRTDVVLIAIRSVGLSIRQMKEQQTQLIDRKNRNVRARRRLKSDHTFVHDMLDKKIQNIDEAIKAANWKIEQFKAAAKLLEQFKYDLAVAGTIGWGLNRSWAAIGQW